MTDAQLPQRLAPVAPASDALFVYGTLLFPRVLTALLGRTPESTPATVTGWRTATLRNRPYPGLVRAEGHTTPGLLLTGLTAPEWRVLDDFEDDDYALRALALDPAPLDPAPPGAGTRAAPAEAWVYTWVSPGEVRATTWEAAAFEERQLDAYAARLESAGS